MELLEKGQLSEFVFSSVMQMGVNFIHQTVMKMNAVQIHVDYSEIRSIQNQSGSEPACTAVLTLVVR